MAGRPQHCDHPVHSFHLIQAHDAARHNAPRCLGAQSARGLMTEEEDVAIALQLRLVHPLRVDRVADPVADNDADDDAKQVVDATRALHQDHLGPSQAERIWVGQGFQFRLKPRSCQQEL